MTGLPPFASMTIGQQVVLLTLLAHRHSEMSQIAIECAVDQTLVPASVPPALDVLIKEGIVQVFDGSNGREYTLTSAAIDKYLPREPAATPKVVERKPDLWRVRAARAKAVAVLTMLQQDRAGQYTHSQRTAHMRFACDILEHVVESLQDELRLYSEPSFTPEVDDIPF